MNLSSFALRRGALVILILAFASVLAACSGAEESEPADGGNGGGGTATVENGAVEVTAADLAFDVSTIQATAGEAFTITLVNDDSAPHNITLYTEEGGEMIGSAGPTAEGGQTVTTDVGALEPGTYYFQCDIHPEMNGTIEVSG